MFKSEELYLASVRIITTFSRALSGRWIDVRSAGRYIRNMRATRVAPALDSKDKYILQEEFLQH